MNDQPYVPIFFGDVLRQTLFWTGEERALYVLLLLVQWHGGPLPLDLPALAASLHFDQQAFLKLWSSNVRSQFVETDRGFINEGLEGHREFLARRALKLSAAGRKGGKNTQAKARKERQARVQPELEASAEAGPSKGLQPASDPGSSIPIQSNPIQDKAGEEPQFSDPTSERSLASADSSASVPAVAGRNGSEGPLFQEPERSSAPTAKRSRRMPKDFDAEPLREFAREHTPHIDFDAEVAMLRDHEFRDPHSDWPAVTRNWLRKAERDRPRARGEQPTRFEQHKARLYRGA